MKYVKNIFLVLTFALSAAAFSTSAMAASDTKSPPKANDIPSRVSPGYE
ncbi:PagK family vesicle-borne virulence factor [Salmonella enterica subsp. diarizonae serovar b,50:-:-]